MSLTNTDYDYIHSHLFPQHQGTPCSSPSISIKALVRSRSTSPGKAVSWKLWETLGENLYNCSLPVVFSSTKHWCYSLLFPIVYGGKTSMSSIVFLSRKHWWQDRGMGTVWVNIFPNCVSMCKVLISWKPSTSTTPWHPARPTIPPRSPHGAHDPIWGVQQHSVGVLPKPFKLKLPFLSCRELKDRTSPDWVVIFTPPHFWWTFGPSPVGHIHETYEVYRQGRMDFTIEYVQL